MDRPISPLQWRLRAAETRAIADGLQGLDAKRILYGLADDYERMAQSLERESFAQPIRRQQR